MNWKKLKFVWPFLKIGEVLFNSTAAISGDRIEVAPNLVPIELVPTFDNTPHRVYMSATLVDDAALVRNFAAAPDSVKKPITPKVGGDIGERLIISPPLVDPNFEELATIDLVSQMRSDHEANVVVLVPSTRRANIWKTDDSLNVPEMDISTVIQRLCDSESNLAIIANRYDGIDLPDEACRILVVDDLPQEHRLANLIEATSRRQSPILRRHIAQRIEQGMGRGVSAEEPSIFVVQRVSQRDRLSSRRDSEQDKHDWRDAARDGDEAGAYAEEDAFLVFGGGMGGAHLASVPLDR